MAIAECELLEEPLTITIKVPGLPDSSGRLQWGIHKVPWTLNSTIATYVPEELQIEKVLLDGNFVHKEDWSLTRLRPDAELIVIPQFGSGYEALAIGIASMVTMTVASFMISMALAPSPADLSPRKDRGAESFSFSGFTLDTHAGVPIPVIYGRHKTAGVLISSFLSVVDSPDQRDPTKDVFNMLILLCHGEIEAIESVEINDQPYTNYKDITVYTRLGTNPQTAIPGFNELANTIEINFNIVPEGTATYTTNATNVIAFEVVVRWPGGLFRVNEKGSMKSNGYKYRVDYRVSGGGSWTEAGERRVDKEVRGQLTNIFRVDIPESIGPNQFDIKVYEIWVEEKSSGSTWEAVFAGVTEITRDTSFDNTYPGYALLGVRGIATDQLSGTVPNITSIVRGKKVRQWTDKLEPPVPPTTVLNPVVGLMEKGKRQYKVTYVTAVGETTASHASDVLDAPALSKIDIAVTASVQAGVTGINLYRTRGILPSPSTAISSYSLAAGNGDTEFAIFPGVYDYAIAFETADGETGLTVTDAEVAPADFYPGPDPFIVVDALTANGIFTNEDEYNYQDYLMDFAGNDPNIRREHYRNTINRFVQISLTGIPISSDIRVVGRKIYRRLNPIHYQIIVGGEEPNIEIGQTIPFDDINWKLIGSIYDNTTTTFVDKNVNPGKLPFSSTQSGANPDNIYKLVVSLPNTTATYTDNIVDASLSVTEPPTENLASVTPYWSNSFWTDKPPWVIYDMFSNPIYGLGRWISTTELNEQSFKDASDYCKALVDSGETYYSCTAQSGGASTVTLAVGASAINNIYVNKLAKIVGGQGSGQSSLITAYNGTTKVATVADAWTIQPNSTSLIEIHNTEERCNIDIVVNTAREALDLLLEEFAAPHRLSLLLINGKWSLLVDQPVEATQMFTMSNIDKDSFRLEFSSYRDRYNTFMTQYHDREKNFEIETLEIASRVDVDILDNPRRIRQQSFHGVTRRSQVLRESRYHLNNAFFLRRQITFDASIDSVLLTAGDTFWFQHDLPGYGLKGGRVVSATISTVTINKEVTISAGSIYKIRVRSVDISGVETFQEKVVTNAIGSHTVLTVDTNFSTIPSADDVYSFGIVPVVKFRAISVQDAGVASRRITGTEYSDSVYLENPILISVSQSSLPHPSAPPGQVEDLLGYEDSGIDFSIDPKSTIIIEWKRPSLDATKGLYNGVKVYLRNIKNNAYSVYSVINGNNIFTYKLINMPVGETFDIKVVSTSAYGVDANFDLAPVVRVSTTNIYFNPEVPRGLELFLQGNENSAYISDIFVSYFKGRDAKFTWKRVSPLGVLFRNGTYDYSYEFLNVGAYGQSNANLFIKDYQVQIIDITTNAILRTEFVVDPVYIYTYEKNLEDNSGSILRTFDISIRSRSTLNLLSNGTNILRVSNPIPDMSAVIPTVTSIVEGLTVDWSTYDVTQDFDLEKYVIYCDTSNPPTTLVGERSKSQTTFIIPNLIPGATYYVKIVPYDIFGAGTASVIVNGIPTRGDTQYLLTSPDAVSLTPSYNGMSYLAVDTSDSEIDLITVDSATNDLYWGETTFTGEEITALASKYSGATSYLAAPVVFDGTKLQAAVNVLAGSYLTYARLTKSGSKEVDPPSNLFAVTSIPTNSVAIAYYNNLVYYVWVDGTNVRFGTTDTSGSIQTAAITLGTIPGTATSGRIVMCVDSDGNAHVFNDMLDALSQYRIDYRKVSSTGTVLVATVGLLTSTGLFYKANVLLTALAFFDDNYVHLVYAKQLASSTKYTYNILYMRKDGTIERPGYVFYERNNSSVGIGTYNNTLKSFWLPFIKITADYDISILRFTKIGRY